MSAVQRSNGPLADVSHFTGVGTAYPTLAALASDAEPARVLISGIAGSGKTAILRHAQHILEERGVRFILLDDTDDLTKIPASHVLLVDDVHLLDDELLTDVRQRANDPRAGLIVTSRPWPRSETLAGIARQLERSQPAIVLGQVSRSDVLDYLDLHEDAVPAACVEHILQMTGGVSWLVSAALAAHDVRDCDDDDAHMALRGVLEQSIAHRLDTVDDALRFSIEALSFDSLEGLAAASDATSDVDDVIAQGYAEGLLQRNGQPVPVVRSAVRATIPTRRLVGYATGVAANGARVDANREWLTQIHDLRLGTALAQSADRLRDKDPRGAEELYRVAVEAGADAAELAPRRARAAWARGDLDAAAQFVDEAMSSPSALEDSMLADTGAATWAARGMLTMGWGFYRALPSINPDSSTAALIAQIGVGDWVEKTSDPVAEADGSAARTAAPTTVRVALELLHRGLESSLRPGCADEALASLIRASHLYTSSKSVAPIPELPAVIATIVAINLGDLTAARSVIDAAIAGDQGGEWARARLLLWSAWVSMLHVRPHEMHEALDAAVRTAGILSPRDDLMAQALRVGAARRWDDNTRLATAWQNARDCIQRVDIDLYTMLPLAEFVSAAARLDDDAIIDPHFAKALAIVETLGSPPLWAAQLRWAGIQHGILVNRPDTLGSHARALVEASPVSRVAATMASAGRTWSSVLAGTVDVDAVEAAAQSLATIGLAWDAARLAGYGASQSSDRKISARLLARARELHPQDSGRVAVHSPDEQRETVPESSVLSDREIDVARLVVQGKTYAEIGETIFISPRTAEHHIASIRRRLGATSRSDLIAKLRAALEPARASQEAR